MAPTLAGFLEFIRGVMDISTINLPDDSPYIEAAYDQAIQTVNLTLSELGLAHNKALPSMYAIAVYNLAGDRLINIAPDQAGAEYVEGSNPPLKFFAYTRKLYNIYGFISGVVQSTSDNGTGGSFVVPKQFEGLTLMDLQNLKTPWGRDYLAIAQQYGPTIWGLT